MVGSNLTVIFETLKEQGIVKNKKDFCEKIGIDFRNYSKYTNNDLAFEIDSRNYEKIKALNINIEFLLIGKGVPLLPFSSQLPGSIGADTLKEALPIITELVDLTAEQKQEILDFIKEIKK